VQRRTHDPVDPPGRRRLDPLRPAARQQLVADQVRAPLGLAHVGGQPPGQLVRVGHRALPEPKLCADLRPVVLDRAPGPLVKAQFGRVHPDLAGDELDSFVGQLAATAREPADPRVDLQQQREPQPGRAPLARDQRLLVIQQRPVLDKLIEIQ
jgi:hypothetical protein